MEQEQTKRTPAELIDAARRCRGRLGSCYGVIGGMTVQEIRGLLGDLADALEASALTFEEFGKLHRPTRIFQRYTHEQRSNHHDSFRLGPRQREAIGEFYYVTPYCPNVAFPTAKRARLAAWEAYQQGVRL